MNTREISRSTVDLTAELEAEIRSRTHIRPDAPNTKPGDVGNGHIIVIDHRTQKFNGETYRLYAKANYFVRFIGKKQLFLHKEVWVFHNGPAPKGCCVHHEHKNEHGQWDTSCNDIECLLLMTPAEHKAWHAKYHPLIELECVICHDTFFAKSKTAKYCLKCAKEVALEKNRVHRNKNRKAFTGFVESADILPAVQSAQLDIPRAKGKGAKEIRYCYFCKRPFETLISKEVITCDRPDCQGRAALNAAKQAELFAHRRNIEYSMKLNDGFLKYTYKTLKKHIRCLLIDGEVWFVAKDVCDAFEYKNSRKALSDHVDDEDKRILKREEFLTVTKRYGQSSTDAEQDGQKGGAQMMSFINLSGFFALSFGSTMPDAKKFRRWVTDVVLPSIMRYGRFELTEETAPPPLLPADTALVLVDADDRPLIP